MSARRTSFGKVERERAKKAKAAAKRELRQTRSSDADLDDAPEATGPPAVANGRPGTSTAELLQQVETLHHRFDAGELAYEDFEQQKTDLLGRIRLD